MENYKYRVKLGHHKARNEKEVLALQTAVDASGFQVRSLMIAVDSLNGLAAQQKLLENPCLTAGLENLELNLNVSLGATSLDVLANVIEARHLSSLIHLSITYQDDKHQRQHSHSSSSSQQGRSSSSYSTFSMSISGGRSGTYTSSSSSSTSTSRKSHTSSFEDGTSRQEVKISWEGFATLARVLRKNLIPKLGNTVSLSSNWGSRNLGDVGVKYLAELIDTGYLSPMKELDLENNSIGSVGMEALAGALRRGNMVALEVLNLNNNDAFHPSVAGILEVVRVMEENHLPRLKWIGLSGAGQQPLLPNGGSLADEVVAAFTRNTSLNTEVQMDWPDTRVQERWNVVLERNMKLCSILQKLGGQEEVPVTNGKILICGFPGRGKTTVCSSLRRSRFGAFIRKERKPLHQKPTQGIEVTKIEEISRRNCGRKFSLTLWDLAGREEFQVLHSSFLPDLGLANGRGTMFVVVLDARYTRSSTESPSAEDELVHWLRFIASSSIMGVKRKVLVALNTFNGNSCTGKEKWTELLKCQHKKYKEILDICTQPFVLDARVAKSVSQLKQALFQHTKKSLHNVRWPAICQYIQQNLELWSAENQNFPILHWSEFEGKLAASKLGADDLEAAVEYLHETGDVIYFRRGFLMEDETKLIVLNPQWFCNSVVGQLLLPEGMLTEGETSLKKCVAPDGSLGISELTAYFKELLLNEHQMNTLLGVLFLLGLCYGVGKDRVLIPALIENQVLKLWKEKEGQPNSAHWWVPYSEGT
ncbi:unnamed protein product [Calypogeia fissa]